MAITSWTSEGMVWGSLADVKLSFPWRRNEAIRQATVERWRAVNNGISGLPSILQNEIPKLDFVIDFMEAIDTYLPQLYDNFTEPTEFDPPQVSLWEYTNARILTAIGDASFYPSDRLDFTAEWCWQRYKILNVLRYHYTTYSRGNVVYTDVYIKDWPPGTTWVAEVGGQTLQTSANTATGEARRRRGKIEVSNMINGMNKNIYMFLFTHWPSGPLFNTWDNRDIYNNNLEMNKYTVVTYDTGYTGATEKSSYYNNIDVFPTGGTPDPGAWRSSYNDVGKGFPGAIIDYEFAYRDW